MAEKASEKLKLQGVPAAPAPESVNGAAGFPVPAAESGGGAAGFSAPAIESGDDTPELDAAVEAVLFAYGKPISLGDLCDSLDMDRAAVADSLTRLAELYESQKRGIQLLRLGNSYQLCTRPEFALYIRRAMELSEPNQLPKAAIEVLLIIANFQPTTQRFIDEIRGVDSSYWLAWLIERELIEPVGKLERRGQPRAYATTLEFLRMFHFSSLSDVPEVSVHKTDETMAEQSELDFSELEGLLN